MSVVPAPLDICNPVDEYDESCEASILHNVYPDSCSDEEDDEHVRVNVTRLESYGAELLKVGQCFYDGGDIKAAVLDHALTEGRNIRQSRYDKNKMEFTCIGGNCTWRIWCAIRSHGDKWEVMTYIDKHGCVPNGECGLMKIPVIAQLFMDRIRDDPKYYMPRKMEEIIKEKWKVNVSRDQCQKARIQALKMIESWYDEQFKRLKDYEAELKDSNPNSSVEVGTYVNANGLTVFDKFYVCFDVLRKTFREHCRPVIGVDGTFLKGKMKGILLVALERDGDNCIYPFAWAIVQREDTTNWRWFFQKLNVDLNLRNGEGYVLVSDRQKGLCNAVEMELPKIEHRMCVRHIYHNLKRKHGANMDLKRIVFNLAWSYNEAQFEKNLRVIYRCDEQLYNDVLDKKPKSWCRAYYALGSCVEDVTNNSTESFNATIVRARELPLVPLLEMVSKQAMVRIVSRSIRALNHTSIITPYAQALLAELLPKAGECTVFPSTNQCYLVQVSTSSFRVSLPRRTCTCGKWEIREIPCKHAYSVMLGKSLQVEDFVERWFTKDTWIMTYQAGITPPRGSDFWPRGFHPELHRPPSPELPGRKKRTVANKQKRKRCINESPTKTASKVGKRTMHCSICERPGHNSKGHRKLYGGGSQSQGDGSQPQLECSQEKMQLDLSRLD